MNTLLIKPVSQVKVATGICSVCQEYRDIFHKVELPRSKKLLVQYCVSCFE